MGETVVSERIEFTATVVKVQTLADHGIRLTLDLLETNIVEAAKLMECKRQGASLRVRVEPSDSTGSVVRRDPRARKS
jgi:hypothetical protein